MRTILSQIFRCYVLRLEEELRGVELFSSAAKNRLLIDIQYLITQLSSLDGVDGPGNHLEVCVNNIKIKDKRNYVPAAPRSNVSASSNMQNLKSSTPVAPASAPRNMYFNYLSVIDLAESLGKTTQIFNKIGLKVINLLFSSD